MDNQTTHCGYIAIIGRPNVGKSTLLNKLLGQKVSITSRKPQTTRHRILGIKTENSIQALFVDTPGLYLKPKHVMNQMMIKSALTTIHDVDIVVFVVDARKWTEEDDYVLNKLKHAKCPIFLVLNKVDKIKNKDDLLPILQNLKSKIEERGIKVADFFPISAVKGSNVADLEKALYSLLPEKHFLYPEDQITDKNDRFFAAELIREKLMRCLGQEVPHAVTVSIEEFKVKENATGNPILHISATIWVDRKGQKIIIIGKKGEGLKQVGYQARTEMEKIFEQKIFLRLWVKVKEGWMDDSRALQSLGYAE